MKFSKEKIEEVKKQIRRCLVEDSRASNQEIADKLGYDRKFIWRLKEKIYKERAKRFDHYTVNTILANFQDKDYEFCKILWKIINDSETTVKEKILAIRELRNSNRELFDKMADAGVFERKLGKLEIGKKLTPEEEALIKKAIALDYGVKKPDKKIDKPQEKSHN